MLLERYLDCGLSIKLFWVFWQVQFLRTKYRVVDIEVDGGVGTLTIEAAAQVANDTVTALMFIQCNYCQRNEKMVYTICTVESAQIQGSKLNHCQSHCYSDE